MIEKLTIAKLKEYGFEKETIERLKNWDNYEANLIADNGYFFASNIENKIYSGKDGFFKVCGTNAFPYHNINLVPEYYNRKQAAYIDKKRELLKDIYIEDVAKKQFKLDEIANIKAILQYRKNKGLVTRQRNEKLEGYSKWISSSTDVTILGNISFESKLTDRQIKALLAPLNEMKLFKIPVSLPTLKTLFNDKLSKPLEVANNQILACLFNCLKNEFLVTDQWKSVIEKNKCFIGARGKLMTASNLSSSMNSISLKNPTVKRINDLIKSL